MQACGCPRRQRPPSIFSFLSPSRSLSLSLLSSLSKETWGFSQARISSSSISHRPSSRDLDTSHCPNLNQGRLRGESERKRETERDWQAKSSSIKTNAGSSLGNKPLFLLNRDGLPGRPRHGGLRPHHPLLGGDLRDLLPDAAVRGLASKRTCFFFGDDNDFDDDDGGETLSSHQLAHSSNHSVSPLHSLPLSLSRSTSSRSRRTSSCSQQEATRT